MITGSPPFGLFFSEMTILQGRVLRAARGGDGGVPRRAGRALLRLLRIRSGRLVLGPAARPDRPARPAARAVRPRHGARRSSAAVLAVVSAFYLPGAAAGAHPRGDAGRVEGRMSSVDRGRRRRRSASPTARVREPRPGELRAGRRAGRAARRSPTASSRGLGARLAVAVRDRRARAERALRRCTTSGRCRASGRSCASRRRSIRPRPRFPSIAAKHPAANWFEREVMDFFGLVPEGHPNPTRVALHDDWPDGRVGAAQGLPGRPRGAARARATSIRSAR